MKTALPYGEDFLAVLEDGADVVPDWPSLVDMVELSEAPQ